MQSPPFRVTHVLLDVDGTLVDYVGALRASFAAAAARCSTLTRRPITGDDVTAVRVAVGADPGWAARSLRDLRFEAFRRVLSAHGVDSEAAVLAVAHDYHRARDEALLVYPDVPDALAALRELGLTLIAASNGNVDLARVGLGEYIAGTHYADEVGYSKPDPRFFTRALERYQIAPRAALVVGDRIDNDYAPAQAAGLPAVLLDRAQQVTDGAVLRIDSLTELPALLARADS